MYFCQSKPEGGYKPRPATNEEQEQAKLDLLEIYKKEHGGREPQIVSFAPNLHKGFVNGIKMDAE